MSEPTVMSALNDIEILLRRMQVLAEHAAFDEISDSERAALQQRLALLREQLDLAAERLDAAKREQDAFFSDIRI